MTVVFHDYTPVGNQRKLWGLDERLVLIEGPAGTGKTRNVIEHDFEYLERNPGARFLYVRQTRESLTESVLWQLEEEVIPPGHPMLTSSAEHRRRRSEYRHPNGSVILVRGLDKPGRTYSQQYTRIRVFEAWEVSLDAFERLLRCLRHPKGGRRQVLLDTNPADEYHWINQMALERENEHPEHGLFRICTTHQDNPLFWDAEAGTWTPAGQEYVRETLEGMSDERRANLLEGRWSLASGAILPEFSPQTHILDPGSLRLPPLVDTEKEDGPRFYEWYFGSLDVGIGHPGCLTIWGVWQGKMFAVVEVYQTGWVQEDWLKVVFELHDEFPLGALVVDPSERDYITTLNRRFGPAMGRDGMPIARKGKNAIMAGIDMLRWMLRDHRIFWLKDRMRYGIDPERRRKKMPATTTEEIPSWVLLKREDGKYVPDKPDPRCADHGIDQTRYAVMFLNIDRDMSPVPPPKRYERFTAGDVLDFHDEEKRFTG